MKFDEKWIKFTKIRRPFRSSQDWDTVEERFQKGLTTWKRQYLSKGGRLTLIKLAYILHGSFCHPEEVELRLEKIQRDFLSKGGAMEKKTHLVAVQ